MNMENLSCAVQGTRVVMMCGVSGSGKTYVARRLQEQGFIRLSADRAVWDVHGPAYAELPQPRQRSEYRRITGIMLSELPDILARGERVVIDAAMCKRAARDSIRAVCREAGVECLLIYMAVPEHELLLRLASRHGSGPDDQTVTLAELRGFLCNFEAPGDDEPHIRW